MSETRCPNCDVERKACQCITLFGERANTMRNEIENEEYRLVYGIDHIEGLFYKVYALDGVLIDEDSQENNELLTMAVIASLVEQYGFDLWNEVPEEIIE